ncbi:recombinase family protein [Actinomadura citrea]|uniref:recombinase family protein n=1 Tax=Actinomadura citrea TaxID=46158 RepID=UPI0039A6DEB6
MTASASSSRPRQRPGRPCRCPEWVAHLIIKWRLQGHSLARIAIMLTEAQAPTPTGTPSWSKSQVDHALHTRHLLELADGLGIGPEELRHPPRR